MQRRIIPGVIDGRQTLCTLPPEAMAKAAADVMAERRMGAVMVVDGNRLLGIVTERDIVFRLVAKGLPADSTPIGAIMTTDPETLTADDSAMAALEKMQAGRYRHLPVMRGQDICGMVSVRDIYEAVRSILQEDLENTEAMMFGNQYGATG